MSVKTGGAVWAIPSVAVAASAAVSPITRLILFAPSRAMVSHNARIGRDPGLPSLDAHANQNLRFPAHCRACRVVLVEERGGAVAGGLPRRGQRVLRRPVCDADHAGNTRAGKIRSRRG